MYNNFLHFDILAGCVTRRVQTMSFFQGIVPCTFELFLVSMAQFPWLETESAFRETRIVAPRFFLSPRDRNNENPAEKMETCMILK